MKKLMIVLIFAVLLIGTVLAGAGVFENKDKDIILTKVQKNALKDMDLEQYTLTDIMISDDVIERCLYKKDAVNTCQRVPTFYMKCGLTNETSHMCITEVRVDYSEAEIDSILDDWEKQRLEVIADTKISRDGKTKTKVAEGITTIKEK